MAAAALKAEAEEPPASARAGLRTPEGQACDAISGRLERLRAALEKAQDERSAARGAAFDLQERLQSARETEPRRRAAELLGEPLIGVESVAALEGELGRQQAIIQSANETCSVLEQEIITTEQRLGFAQMGLTAAAKIRFDTDPQVDALMVYRDRLRGKLADVDAVFDAIGPTCMPERHRRHLYAANPATVLPAHPIAPVWREAIKRIKVGDAGVDLPAVE
jgi:hypothetical protein